MASPIVDRIRIIPRAKDFLDRNIGASGEIYYSKTTKTLRVYDGLDRGGSEVVTDDNIRRTTAGQEVAAVKYNVTVNHGNHGLGDHGNVYIIDGEYKPTLDFIVGFTYVFDQSDSTNVYYPNPQGGTLNIHPILFSTTANGTWDSGTVYETGVMYLLDEKEVTRQKYIDDFAKASTRHVLITITSGTPATLYYFCSQHTGMGADAEKAYPGGGSGTSISVNDAPPEGPENGNLWLNTTNGNLYVYVQDTDSAQWVQPSVPTNINLQGGFNQVSVEGTDILLYSGQVLNFASSTGIDLSTDVATRTITIGTDGLATTAYVDSAVSAASGVDLTAFSVGAEPAASGNGQLTYNNVQGVFTYTPPDLSGFVALDAFSVTTVSPSGTGNLTYNNQTGAFTFTPPASSGTLDDVTTNGATTTNDISVGNITSSGTVTADDFIAGGTGTPELSSATTLTLDSADGTIVTGGPFRLPSFTTADKNSLTAVNGDMVYDSDLNKAQVYENGAWVSLV